MLTLTMNPALDKSALITQVMPNEKLRCQLPSFEPGGGGVNVARVVKRLGSEAQAIYPGGGATAEHFEQLLREEGIDQKRIQVKNRMRENLTVTEKTTGNQYRFVFPGAPLDTQEWEKCLEIVLDQAREKKFVVVSGSLPPSVPDDFYARLVCKIRNMDHDVKLIVDTSGKPLVKLHKTGFFLLKPNLRELRDLTGRDLKSENEQEKASKELIDEGTCEVVILSLGPAGLLLSTKQMQKHFRSPTVTVKSRVGAGDSTVAGIVTGLMRNYDIEEAVMLGIAAGAAAAMTPGTELCRREDVEYLFKNMKNKNKV